MSHKIFTQDDMLDKTQALVKDPGFEPVWFEITMSNFDCYILNSIVCVDHEFDNELVEFPASWILEVK